MQRMTATNSAAHRVINGLTGPPRDTRTAGKTFELGIIWWNSPSSREPVCYRPVGRPASCKSYAAAQRPTHEQEARVLRFGIVRPSACLFLTQDIRPEGESNGGPDRDRTGDLMNAIHARSQLRYWPTQVRDLS